MRQFAFQTTKALHSQQHLSHKEPVEGRPLHIDPRTGPQEAAARRAWLLKTKKKEEERGERKEKEGEGRKERKKKKKEKDNMRTSPKKN